MMPRSPQDPKNKTWQNIAVCSLLPATKAPSDGSQQRLPLPFTKPLNKLLRPWQCDAVGLKKTRGALYDSRGISTCPNAGIGTPVARLPAWCALAALHSALLQLSGVRCMTRGR